MADKYFMATLEYNEPHVDKYLISNVNTEKEAKDIAENHNADPKYSQVWKEDKGDIEDQTVTVKEVVWSSEKNDFVDKQTEPQLKGYN